MACESSANASPSGATSRRLSSPARWASMWQSISSPTRTGTRIDSSRARLVHERTGGGEHQRQYALSGHRDLDYRTTPVADTRLSLVRYPACRVADKVAACGVLSRASAHPAGAVPQAYDLVDRADVCRRARAQSRPRADQFHACHHELRQGLQYREDVGGSCKVGPLRIAVAAGGDE